MNEKAPCSLGDNKRRCQSPWWCICYLTGLLQAIVAAFGVDERTVRAWGAASGAHCQAVPEHLVERPQDLGQVPCDELRVKAQGKVLWVTMVVCVQPRLWLEAAVRAQRVRAVSGALEAGGYLVGTVYNTPRLFVALPIALSDQKMT